jgi:hypothetical protein
MYVQNSILLFISCDLSHPIGAHLAALVPPPAATTATVATAATTLATVP